MQTESVSYSLLFMKANGDGHFVTNGKKEIVFERLAKKNTKGKVISLSCKSPDRTIIF
jgi:hypothetical protein